MLIIPTEKRFDWQQAPIVLFAIVALNCLIFFFYQSGDTLKYFQAFEHYSSTGLFELEWPEYESYLEDSGDTLTLLEHRNALAEENSGGVMFDMLHDPAFFEYLKAQRDNFLEPDQIDDWTRERQAVHDLIFSTSALRFGLVPADLSILTLLSHQFLHGDFMHLLGNMFFLIICGFAVEAAIGHLRFLAFYLLSGIGGGLLFFATDPASTIPLVGASGAISGVMAMYVAAFRLRKIEFFYWFFIFVGYIRAPALLILAFYIGKELIDYFTNTGSNVAYMAHVGGFVVGGALIIGALFFDRDIFNTEYLDEDQSMDPKAQKLAEVYRLMEKYHFRSALNSLNSLIDEHGNHFELQKLQYHLMKTQPDRHFPEAVFRLLRHRPTDERELIDLLDVWRENPELRHRLDVDSQVRLALNFATPDHLKVAESIFDRLSADRSNHNSLGVLARKLALCFESLGNRAKQQSYSAFAVESGGGLR